MDRAGNYPDPATNCTIVLVAKNITKKFSGVTALDDICLELYPGKVNAIIGENGGGEIYIDEDFFRRAYRIRRGNSA